MGKDTTCWPWTQGTCPNSALACTEAHHFFLDVQYRAHSKADKNSVCVDLPNCRWRDSRCGRKHEKADANPELEKQYQAAESSMPWETKIILKCKICGKEEPGVKHMGDHMRISHRAWWDGEDTRDLAEMQRASIRSSSWGSGRSDHQRSDSGRSSLARDDSLGPSTKPGSILLKKTRRGSGPTKDEIMAMRNWRAEEKPLKKSEEKPKDPRL